MKFSASLHGEVKDCDQLGWFNSPAKAIDAWMDGNNDDRYGHLHIHSDHDIEIDIIDIQVVIGGTLRMQRAQMARLRNMDSNVYDDVMAAINLMR